MNNSNPFVRLALGLFLLLACAGTALAQETTSSIRVDTYGSDNAPVEGASVTVTDTRTATRREGTTGSAGSVTFSGLRVGGPYTVNVRSDAFGAQTVTDIYLRLGDTYLLPLSLASGELEEVVVTATQVQTVNLALGPASTFGLEDLQDYPAINRDIRDVIRFDPRIYQDDAFVGAIQCGGANPRFNSLTVDGVRFNDNFGLNSNGYPTERQPFPYDSIQQVAVELAPFDVQYGGFTACNINAVTKSGQNEFFGSIFFDYTDDSMRGSKLEGDKIELGNFEEKRYGVSMGGPIIKDKLFFFVAYEKLEGANLFDRGPAGSGRANEIQGVSQAQFDEIKSILQNTYGFDPGGLPLSLPNEDEKYTIKIDWDINDNHRLAYTYNYNDGFNIAQSDTFSGAIEFGKHYYERGAELKAHTAALFSDWTDRFTTEIRVSNFKLDNRQISRADTGGPDNTRFPEFQIRTYNDGYSATVFAGIDDSRQANKLNYETWNYKLAGAYALNNHLLTFGYELDDLSIFNLFLQHTQTEDRFDSTCSTSNPNGCIDALRNGTPNRVYYGNSRITNDPNDSAADWGYQINTAYLQDEFTAAGGAVTLVAGLRYDWYTSSDYPRENPAFVARAGYSNAMNLDGEGLLQPRFGFTWDFRDNVTIRGGIGLFSGGNPNVWLSNNYSTDGYTQIQVPNNYLAEVYGSGFSLFDIPLGPDGNGMPGFDVPTALIDYVAGAQADTGVNALDPNFDIPSNWKVDLGVTWDISSHYQMTADVLLTKAEDSAIIVCGTCVKSGVAPDGRPVYTDPRRFNSDYILTNVTGPDAKSTVLSIGMNANYDNGFDWSVGYAYTDAQEVSPMTSSVAFSNFANIAVDDFNHPSLSTANYEIPHRFTFRASYTAYWWDDNRTKFSIFGAINQGRPYSYTFARDDGDAFGDYIDYRHLLYVPTGPDDPLVVFADSFDTSAFFDFVNESGLSKYAGGIAPRNAFNSSWWGHFDLRIEQEFPGFRKDHHFAAFMVIRNFCNMINDNWCTLKEVGFPRTEGVVDMAIDNGQYVYQEFFKPSGESRVADASLYEIRVGLKYDF